MAGAQCGCSEFRSCTPPVPVIPCGFSKLRRGLQVSTFPESALLLCFVCLCFFTSQQGRQGSLDFFLAFSPLNEDHSHTCRPLFTKKPRQPPSSFPYLLLSSSTLETCTVSIKRILLMAHFSLVYLTVDLSLSLLFHFCLVSRNIYHPITCRPGCSCWLLVLMK